MALSSDDRTLYVGNLDKNVSEDVLYELFLQAGPIERVNIVNSNPNSCHYGFVTYKHEVSIEYALQLYKGTHLFSKELFVKKKGKSNRNGQSNDFKKHNALNSLKIYSKKGSDLRQLARNEMRNGLQNVRLNNNCDSQMIFNFKPNSVEENWSTRNKQYDRGPRKYSSRSHEQRRHKGRNSSNKLHHSRKTRY